MLCRQNNGFGRNSKNNKIRNDKIYTLNRHYA